MFEKSVFYLCYDAGYGEKSVLEHALSFDNAYAAISKRAGEAVANEWKETKETYFNFKMYYYMVEEKLFEDQDWEGSLDY